MAEHPDIPAELALQGFAGVRMYAPNAERGRELLEQTLGFDAGGRAHAGRSRARIAARFYGG